MFFTPSLKQTVTLQFIQSGKDIQRVTCNYPLSHHGSFIYIHSRINGADKIAYTIWDHTGVKSRTQRLATYCVQIFTATLSESLNARYKGAGVGATLTDHKAVKLHLKSLLPTVPIFSTAQDHSQTAFHNQRHHLAIPNLDQYCSPLKPLLHSLLL